MTFHSLRRISALCLIASLAACGGGGGSRAAVPTTPSGSTGTAAPITSSAALVQTLTMSKKFTGAAVRGALATDVGGLSMHVVVALRNGTGLASYAASSNTRGNANYRHWLTASQIGDAYGASASDYKAVANYFAGYGLRVGGYPQRLALTVAGPRTAFESALGVTFSHYTTAEGHRVVAPTNATVRFAKALPVSQIADVVFDTTERHTQFVRGGPTTANLGAGYVPQQIATAFDFTGAYAAGYTGTGIHIGIIGTGPFGPNEFPSYKAKFGLTGAASVTLRAGTSAAAANAGSSPAATPPPVVGISEELGGTCDNSTSGIPTSTCNPEDGETQIDTEQAALARDASILYYLTYIPVECDTPGSATCTPDPNSGLGYAYQGIEETDDEVQQAIADNDPASGVPGPDVLSLSYGAPEMLEGAYAGQASGNTYDPTGFGPTEFAALASQGVAVFVSSGDDGAEACAPYAESLENTPCVSYPAGDVSVTSVGGVTIPLSNAGQLLGPITAWGTQTGTGGASGGGTSTFTPVPPWQTGAGVPATYRSQPDLSLEADPATGVSVAVNTSMNTMYKYLAFGGTSVAAPETAAMWALVLQACKQTASCAIGSGAYPYRLGIAAQYAYGIYNAAQPATSGFPYGGYPATFYDVTFGDTSLVGCQTADDCGSTPPPSPAPGFTAGTGWDPTTGVGVPFARHLIRAVVGV